MVESNVVTVTYSAPPLPVISLSLTVDKSQYNPSTDTLSFFATASQDASGKTVELYVDGQATGLRGTFSFPNLRQLTINVSPSNMPSQLKAQGSHSCKVISVGW